VIASGVGDVDMFHTRRSIAQSTRMRTRASIAGGADGARGVLDEGFGAKWTRVFIQTRRRTLS